MFEIRQQHLAVNRSDILATPPTPSAAAVPAQKRLWPWHRHTGLENDQQALVDALKDGIRLSDRKAVTKAAGDWIALVYGRQLQKPEDEKPGAIARR